MLRRAFKVPSSGDAATTEQEKFYTTQSLSIKPVLSPITTGYTQETYGCFVVASPPPLGAGGVSAGPVPSEVLGVEALGGVGNGCSEEGVVGTAAGFGAGEVSTTDPPWNWEEKIASISEVTIKTPAATVVNLLRKFPGPRGPKTVWLAPPKAAPMPAPLPACKRTIRIRATATTTCTTTNGTYNHTAKASFLPKHYDLGKRRRIQAGPPHQGAIDIRLCHKRLDIPGVDASTILNTDFVCKRFSIQTF